MKPEPDSLAADFNELCAARRRAKESFYWLVPTVADSITESVSTDGVGGAAEWSAPQAAEYAPCKGAFAAWIEAEDAKVSAKGSGSGKFFGLKCYPNTAPGIGDGKGTPLWLCPDCHP